MMINEWDYFDDDIQYHPIANADNLYNAFLKSRKGSHWKSSVQRFRWNTLSEIRKLQNELDNLYHNRQGAYQLSPYSKFIVNERGKIRAITALAIRDRVVKHVLNDLFLLPHTRPYLIYDNGASLEGKGVSFTRRRLVAHLESFYREHHSNDGYIMTMDFSGYYDNIDHATAFKIISQYEHDPFALLLVQQAFNSYRVDVSYLSDDKYKIAKTQKFSTIDYRNENHDISELTGEKYLDKSLSVGDQTSQIMAVLYPTEIDKFITIVNGFKYYGRYMDDFYIIAKTREELLTLMKSIQQVAVKLHLFINSGKTNICKLNHTFRFMQFKYFLSDSGHVVVRINPKTVNKMKLRIKKLSNIVPHDVTSIMFHSWFNGLKQYMSNRQIVCLKQVLHISTKITPPFSAIIT